MSLHTSNNMLEVPMQEVQDSARWQALVHTQTEQQQCEEAQEALHRYLGAAELLKQICQGSAQDVAAELHPGMHVFC